MFLNISSVQVRLFSPMYYHIYSLTGFAEESWEIGEIVLAY